MTQRPVTQDLPNGPLAAALLAAGMGWATIGITTGLSEVSPLIANVFWPALAGPFSIGIGIGLMTYFASWVILHVTWRGKNVNFARVTTLALILLVIGLVGTFPPFLGLFIVSSCASGVRCPYQIRDSRP